MDYHLWLTFFVASWAISLSPGPGALAAMTSGLRYGFVRGYWTTLGLIVGIWTQTLIVGVGLGALIAASNTAFLVVKWLGVAYLVYLGIQQWRAPAVPMVADEARSEAAASAPPTRRSLVWRGWLINAMNPKGTAFMLAVVPQFLDLSQPLALQYLVITATLSFTDLVVMAGYTALASKVLRLLRSPRQIRWMNRTFGSLFVAAATLLAMFKRHG
jgi:homoserine/homoserine lactone efflux protein